MNRYYLSSPSCDFCGQLQKTSVLVQPCSMYMLFMRKLWKTKQNFNWTSLNSFQRLFTCQTTAHLVTQLPRFKHYGMHMKGRAPCYTLQGLHFKWKQKWNNLRMWKCVESLHVFLWELWKLSHIQNYKNGNNTSQNNHLPILDSQQQFTRNVNLHITLQQLRLAAICLNETATAGRLPFD